MIAVDCRLLFAKFTVLERSAPSDTSRAEELLTSAIEQLEEARQITLSNPRTAHKIAEIEEVETMLREDTFYTIVTSAEMQAVYDAMAQDFLGTGHWYYCVNRHPFTVGECGAPMENALCPECGAPVGGESHEFAEGITRATALEQQFGGMRL
ncbi:uncharacterized protein KY384_006687 [Bacidia gigantensis]|uniref:uncharacterized protein n=1 Tax=Bacidia gigantensis TaxID=2732470 RepID=UPI001D05111C|nr:uncharacterized protein KY384_006687 [Bacidia gigantensis]KAG8528998.1 hypothetical protein KY384_006687 [Bacidia gigantensis]